MPSGLCGPRAGVAGSAANSVAVTARTTKRQARQARRKPRLGWVLPVVVAAVVAFLYYRPIASYLETRAQLDARRTEVARLRVDKARVDARLERSSSLEALAREARRIGQVRPGEQLFIVKGIRDWRRANSDR